MAYSGRYTIKNKAKYLGNAKGVVYRSLWERHAFKWADDNPNVIGWSSEEIVVPYYYDVDKKYHRYFVDLYLKMADGREILVEIKPESQTVPPKGQKRTKRYITEGYTYVKNINKWTAAKEYAADRGWHFEIWTEKTLTSMGIMPKSSKPLKPLKPFPKKPKKRV